LLGRLKNRRADRIHGRTSRLAARDQGSAGAASSDREKTREHRLSAVLAPQSCGLLQQVIGASGARADGGRDGVAKSLCRVVVVDDADAGAAGMRGHNGPGRYDRNDGMAGGFEEHAGGQRFVASWLIWQRQHVQAADEFQVRRLRKRAVDDPNRVPTDERRKQPRATLRSPIVLNDDLRAARHLSHGFDELLQILSGMAAVQHADGCRVAALWQTAWGAVPIEQHRQSLNRHAKVTRQGRREFVGLAGDRHIRLARQAGESPDEPWSAHDACGLFAHQAPAALPDQNLEDPAMSRQCRGQHRARKNRQVTAEADDQGVRVASAGGNRCFGEEDAMPEHVVQAGLAVPWPAAIPEPGLNMDPEIFEMVADGIDQRPIGNRDELDSVGAAGRRQRGRISGEMPDPVP